MTEQQARVMKDSNERYIEKIELKESYIYRMAKRGRPAGVTKDSNRARIMNPNGRLIDVNGPQYNKLIKNGYKPDEYGVTLISDKSFTGDGNVKKSVGRPKGKASPIPNSEKVKNPETGRMIKKNGYKCKQLYNKYFYDKDINEFITSVLDPKSEDKISLSSNEFSKRIENGYIYDKLNNSLTKPSKKSEKAFKNAIVVYDLTIVNNTDPIIQMNKLYPRIKVLISKALKKCNGVKFSIGMDIIFSKPDGDDNIRFQVFHITQKSVAVTVKLIQH